MRSKTSNEQNIQFSLDVQWEHPFHYRGIFRTHSKSKMDFFAKIVNILSVLFIFAKSFILNI